jgi:hypothetical protein
MEREKFDAFVRRAQSAASRRGVLRTGVACCRVHANHMHPDGVDMEPLSHYTTKTRRLATRGRYLDRPIGWSSGTIQEEEGYDHAGRGQAGVEAKSGAYAVGKGFACDLQ